jgi:hypothetical protein
LFLPYGKSFCATLAEWRFLISTLSAISESAPEVRTTRTSARRCVDSPDVLYQAESDQGAVLESILNHVCLTLSPEDLLQVLPDDGDLALYMSTIEISMRLDQVRDKQKDTRLLTAVAGGA